MADDNFLTFNIDDDDFKTFIESLLTELSLSTSDNVLYPMPDSEPWSCLYVRLISGNRSITLCIDRRNLFVRGYSPNGGRFWEFSDMTLIPGSRRLEYNGSYVKDHGVGKTAGVALGAVRLGQHHMGNAVTQLSDIEDPNSNQNQSAKLLLTMILMIAEATRNRKIAQHIADNWGSFTTLIPHMVVFVTESSDASHIRSLVRIDYVRIENINGKDPGQLYGIVMVNDYWCQQAVYDRSSDNPENKGPGEYASLTSPSTPIFGADAFIIGVSLWDHDKLSPDDEIAKGDIVWDRRIDDSSYDSPLEEVVSGKYGSVTVGYSVIRDALNATVQVLMIDGDGESPTNVYGTIKALILVGGSSVTRMLLDKAENDYVEVLPQQSSIPLTCEVFPVPVNDYLTIEADLWDEDTLSPKAQGSVQFLPRIGTQEKIITGKCGKVRVSFTCG